MNGGFCIVLKKASVSQAEAAAARDVTRQEPARVLPTGSSAVGKSVVGLVFCAYLAAYHDYDILYIRALSDDPFVPVLVVRFSGCHVTKDPTFSPKAPSISPFQDSFKSESVAVGKKHLVAGDGYESYVFELTGFALGRLTDAVCSPDSVLVLLPAWTKSTLQAKAATSAAQMQTFDERYAVSGGSVGRFLMDPKQLRDSLATEYDFLNWYWRQLRFIKDVDVYEQYLSFIHSHPINDASFALRHLLPESTIDNYAYDCKWSALTTNASLYAMQFTALVTKLAFDRVLKLLISQDKPELLIDASCTVVSGHATSAACLAYLQHDLPPATYWYSGCDDFPAVNGIFVQDGWINYVQTTVLPDHVVAWGELAIVHASVKRNPNLKGYKHRLVLVMPVKVTWVGLEFAPEIDDVVVCTGVVALYRAVDYGKPEATEYMCVCGCQEAPASPGSFT
ncbi:hypothetical protein SDRG_17135 [Saprolegnia diclina VS20]|uniref:Uncharacterized protein n=1 Tax=Saprolegnia diclina (strain VS20) TaxID=1156394 RepID=T0R674_SAPDV|nr:hypothetical protein SDRG_17135 [Saprolegnia diclina VS20]EQC24987.1 hypothetical protein SDRG_17135 [Saprolegnia diclina VS20]|eukprot:XP_008621592.1 hypothetical protein SDRG_17135 [Saprolegnia diclina VS20]